MFLIWRGGEREGNKGEKGDKEGREFKLRCKNYSAGTIRYK